MSDRAPIKDEDWLTPKALRMASVEAKRAATIFNRSTATRAWGNSELEDDVRQDLLLEMTRFARTTFDPGRGLLFTTYYGRRVRSRAFKFAHHQSLPHGFRGKGLARPRRTFLDCPNEDGETFGLPDTSLGRAGAASDAAHETGVAMASLPLRLRRVIQARYFDNQTLDEVGVRMGLSRERIRQLEIKALGLMRQTLDPASAGDGAAYHAPRNPVEKTVAYRVCPERRRVEVLLRDGAPADLEQRVAALPERERTILQELFVKDRPLDVVAHDLDITPAYVTAIKNRALDRLVAGESASPRVSATVPAVRPAPAPATNGAARITTPVPIANGPLPCAYVVHVSGVPVACGSAASVLDLVDLIRARAG